MPGTSKKGPGIDLSAKWIAAHTAMHRPTNCRQLHLQHWSLPKNSPKIALKPLRTELLISQLKEHICAQVASVAINFLQRANATTE